MLDELMGRNRNYDPNDKNAKEIRWSDSGVCRFYLVEFCPHELFTNTKADLVSSNWSFIYLCVHKFAVSIITNVLKLDLLHHLLTTQVNVWEGMEMIA